MEPVSGGAPVFEDGFWAREVTRIMDPGRVVVLLSISG